MLVIKGIVTSGAGLGRKYISMNVYNELFTNILLDKPYNGTLNIVLNDLGVDHIISKCPPHIVSDIRLDGNIYGGFYYWHCNIYKARGLGGVKEYALVIRPFRSRHPNNVVEVVSHKHLRSHMGLTDGDVVIIELYCSEEHE